MLNADRRFAGRRQHRLWGIDLPRPGVAEPRRRQNMECVSFWTGICDLDRHRDVVRIGLGVVNLHDPIAVLVKRAGIEQLVFGVPLGPPAVLLSEILVGEGALWVVITPPIPGMTGEGVEIPPVLLDILAVVGLGPREPERTLLQDRITAVPQRQTKAQSLLDIAEPRQAVLTPTVGL